MPFSGLSEVFNGVADGGVSTWQSTLGAQPGDIRTWRGLAPVMVGMLWAERSVVKVDWAGRSESTPEPIISSGSTAASEATVRLNTSVANPAVPHKQVQLSVLLGELAGDGWIWTEG